MPPAASSRCSPGSICWRSAPAGGGSRSTPRGTTAAASPRRRYRANSTNSRASGSRAPASSDRITLLLEDYRDLRGSYDALVSIEMIEAVGHQYLDTYFRQVQRPAAADRRDAAAGDHHPRPVLRRRRGARSTSSSASSSPAASSRRCRRSSTRAARATDMKLFHLEDIGPHYARTLRLWRERFLRAARARCARRAIPESFVRMWEYYLCYCEGGFEERAARRRADAADQAATPRRAASRPCMPRPPSGGTLAELKAVVGAGGWLGPSPSDIAPLLVDFRRLYRGATPLVLLPRDDGRGVADHCQICAPRHGRGGAAGRQHQLLRGGDAGRERLANRAVDAPAQPGAPRRSRERLDDRRGRLHAGGGAGRRARRSDGCFR